MASSRKRVRSPQTQTTCSDRINRFLDDFEDEADALSAERLSRMESSLHTEIRLPMDVNVKNEIDDGEDFSQLQQSYLTPKQQRTHNLSLENYDNIPQLSPSIFNSETVKPLGIPLDRTSEDGSIYLSTVTTPEDVKNIKQEPEPIPSSSSTHCVPRGYYRPSSLLAFETPDVMQDETLREPDPVPSSSTSRNLPLPCKVPATVSLSFGFSDDEDELPQSPEPSISLMTIPEQGFKSEPSDLPDIMNLNPEPDLDFLKSDTTVEVHHLAGLQTLSSSVFADKNEYPNTSESMHSELHLPVDIEEAKPDIDNPSSLEPESNASSIEANFSSNGVFLDFIQGPQDAIFLEEASMTVGQFNELLKNVLLYKCFQVPGVMNRMKLEAVLKFLVKGESIANLAQHYKIGKQTFSKFLPDVLDAIYGVLGLFRVKTGENRWTKVQKGFTERLGLPNCCGVVSAKTIITWKPDTSTRLPILTITDAEYGILNLDLTAGIEDQGIDFRCTRMYSDIHILGHYERLEIPHLGFVVGNEHLNATRYVYPLYSTVSDDMPIPKLYNNRVERALRVAENTYGILTSKFKVYDKIMSVSPSIVKFVVKATCALHNWLKQTSPGYITPGLVDEESEDGVWKLGSCQTGPKQIFQPIHLYQAKNQIRKNPHARRRDLYAYSLFVLEQTKNSQNTT